MPILIAVVADVLVVGGGWYLIATRRQRRMRARRAVAATRRAVQPATAVVWPSDEWTARVIPDEDGPML